MKMSLCTALCATALVIWLPTPPGPTLVRTRAARTIGENYSRQKTSDDKTTSIVSMPSLAARGKGLEAPRRQPLVISVMRAEAPATGLLSARLRWPSRS